MSLFTQEGRTMTESRAAARQWAIGGVLALFACVSPALGKPAKHIILMISDGGGFNSYVACSYYQHGQTGKQPYDQRGFVKYGCATNSLNSSGKPRDYDAVSMWRDPAFLLGPNTDSAASATALNTGVKTRNGQICTDFHGTELITFAQIADRLGKSTGAVTTVPFSHATPACVWAHNLSRKNMAAIANEMIFGSGLDVIMGTGNPEYNDDGQPEQKSAQYVGGDTVWQMLKNGTTGKGWTLIQTRGEFETLAQKSAPLPARLIGIPQVNTSMQFNRSGTAPAPAAPFNANVPDLKTMAIAAIHVLSQNEKGFYLMIEGGAVDSANHRNNLPRMIEEMTDFNLAVEAVVKWVEANSSWEETLLIVTSDHETGMLWGPNTFTDANQNGLYDAETDGFKGFQPLQNHGAGTLPGYQYGSKGHTTALVPLYARGAGSERFAELVDGVDAKAGEFWDFSGQFVDNTDVFTVMRRAMESDPQ